MSIESELIKRSGNQCELCSSTMQLSVYEVAPSDGTAEQAVLLCESCKGQIENPEQSDPNHWRCLNDSMWSEHPAVQVMAYRILTTIASEGWPQDLLDMMYLEDALKEWALAGLCSQGDEGTQLVKDSNGATLQDGDSVTLIKDLDVKGAGFTAKRGTLVKNISLGNVAEHIEGKVHGTQIYLKTCFLKKS